MTYVPGRIVNQMSTAYRGEAKADARDAFVIAELLAQRAGISKGTFRWRSRPR